MKKIPVSTCNAYLRYSRALNPVCTEEGRAAALGRNSSMVMRVGLKRLSGVGGSDSGEETLVSGAFEP